MGLYGHFIIVRIILLLAVFIFGCMVIGWRDASIPNRAVAAGFLPLLMTIWAAYALSLAWGLTPGLLFLGLDYYILHGGTL